ncbi:MAG: biopolymer transporter ExbD [Phycisphaerales bacterium]|nr:biopolymer transporter ExbD [Phycisphaerales bacterium]
MARRRFERSSHLGALPLTSMIDVVFLLLVYFLVTANFAQQERDLSSSVQAEGGGVRVSELQPQIVEIVLVDGVVEFRIASRWAGSQESLTAILKSLPKEPGVAIRAGRDVPIRAVAAAMQASQDAGFSRRSYVPADE